MDLAARCTGGTADPPPAPSIARLAHRDFHAAYRPHLAPPPAPRGVLHLARRGPGGAARPHLPADGVRAKLPLPAARLPARPRRQRGASVTAGPPRQPA